MEGMILFSTIIVLFVQIVLSSAQTYCQDWYGNTTKEDFITRSCSECFTLIFNQKDLPLRTVPFKFTPNLILKTNFSIQYTPTLTNPPHAEVCKKYLSVGECTQWYDCCVAAKRCCDDQQHESVPQKDNVSYCPSVWDGVECWPAVEEKTTSRLECPTYFVNDNLADTNPTSSKTCVTNGSWYERPTNPGRAWTNYTDCLIQVDQADILRISIYVSFACHVFSLAGLVVAVALYAVFRSYLRRDEKGRCKFNLNVNLFVAFILMGISTIIWEPIYYLDAIENLKDNRLEENTVECRIIKTLIWYFRSATYWWLFCEGLYLRDVLINPIANTRSIFKHLIIGWGLPIPPTIAWAVVKAVTANESCWSGTSEDNLEFIIVVPNLLALLLNLILLITVQVELMRHFADTNDDDVVDLVRQGIKVTFSLIPVFGVQIVVLSYRPKNWLPYDIIANIVVGIQGFMVALMYCFVTKEIRIAYDRFKRNRSVSISKSSSRGTQSSRLSTSIAGWTSGKSDSIPMQELGGVRQNGTRNSTVSAGT